MDYLSGISRGSMKSFTGIAGMNFGGLILLLLKIARGNSIGLNLIAVTITIVLSAKRNKLGRLLGLYYSNVLLCSYIYKFVSKHH